MKEKLYTIPLNDAVNANDECPFCFIEREVERDLLDFVLGSGSSYMEADIRDMTDKAGFCRNHFKKMFDFENTLGNAWILKTLMLRHMNEMTKEFKHFSPSASGKKSLFSKNGSSNSIVDWIDARESSCFICKSVNNTFHAYTKTFFMMYRDDSDFR